MIRVRFQNVRSCMRTVPILCCGVVMDVWYVRRMSCVQNKATHVQPRKRCVILNVLWNLIRMGDRERTR